MERIRSTPTLTTIPRPIMLRLRLSVQPTSGRPIARTSRLFDDSIRPRGNA